VADHGNLDDLVDQVPGLLGNTVVFVSKKDDGAPPGRL
jgi:hypothetical protein